MLVGGDILDIRPLLKKPANHGRAPQDSGDGQRGVPVAVGGVEAHALDDLPCPGLIDAFAAPTEGLVVGPGESFSSSAGHHSSTFRFLWPLAHDRLPPT